MLFIISAEFKFNLSNSSLNEIRIGTCEINYTQTQAIAAVFITCKAYQNPVKCWRMVKAIFKPNGFAGGLATLPPNGDRVATVREDVHDRDTVTVSTNGRRYNVH